MTLLHFLAANPWTALLDRLDAWFIAPLQYPLLLR